MNICVSKFTFSSIGLHTICVPKTSFSTIPAASTKVLGTMQGTKMTSNVGSISPPVRDIGPLDVSPLFRMKLTMHCERGLFDHFLGVELQGIHSEDGSWAMGVVCSCSLDSFPAVGSPPFWGIVLFLVWCKNQQLFE